MKSSLLILSLVLFLLSPLAKAENQMGQFEITEIGSHFKILDQTGTDTGAEIIRWLDDPQLDFKDYLVFVSRSGEVVKINSKGQEVYRNSIKLKLYNHNNFEVGDLWNWTLGPDSTVYGISTAYKYPGNSKRNSWSHVYSLTKQDVQKRSPNLRFMSYSPKLVPLENGNVAVGRGPDGPKRCPAAYFLNSDLKLKDTIKFKSKHCEIGENPLGFVAWNNGLLIHTSWNVFYRKNDRKLFNFDTNYILYNSPMLKLSDEHAVISFYDKQKLEFTVAKIDTNGNQVQSFVIQSLSKTGPNLSQLVLGPDKEIVAFVRHSNTVLDLLILNSDLSVRSMTRLKAPWWKQVELAPVVQNSSVYYYDDGFVKEMDIKTAKVTRQISAAQFNTNVPRIHNGPGQSIFVGRHSKKIGQMWLIE